MASKRREKQERKKMTHKKHWPMVLNFLGGYHHLLAAGNGSKRDEKKEKWHIMLLIYS